METLKEQATRLAVAHTLANGQDGHTPQGEWRNCPHEDCLAFRDSLGLSRSIQKRVVTQLEGDKGRARG